MTNKKNYELEKKLWPHLIPKDGVKKDVPDVMEDFLHARETLLQTIEDCKTSIAELEDLASQSQHARYYEVLNASRKTLVEANRDLLNLQKQIRDINNSDGGPKKVTNNNLFVGTASELLSLIKDPPKVIEHDDDNNSS